MKFSVWVVEFNSRELSFQCELWLIEGNAPQVASVPVNG